MSHMSERQNNNGHNDRHQIDNRPLRVVIINKSDSTGGAAVVSRRLMEAMRGQGIDARMLVVEKLTDSPYIELAGAPLSIKKNFLLERLRIFIGNGFSRKTLFKIDTASDGLPLWKHPLVTGADAILLNWVNQGMLSLKGIQRILDLNKPVIWTMHDMWCMTGICHHAGECNHFHDKCGDCKLLGKLRGQKDLSREIWTRKHSLYTHRNKITFVAVSNWLASKARESSLLRDKKVVVIPNVFPAREYKEKTRREDGKIQLLFGAARLDDPIKGLPILREMTRLISMEHPDLAEKMELTTFGGVKNPESLKGFGISHRHLGVIKGEREIRRVYEDCDILVSASSYETLPGTLVEAQAYGCIPVSFNQGGQSDIVDHLSTGYIAEYSEDTQTAARNLTAGILWATGIISDAAMRHETICRMKQNVADRFSPEAVTEKYVSLF